MHEGRKLTYRKQPHPNPQCDDPEAVKQMYQLIVKRNNPTGLMQMQEQFVDTSPISDYDMKCIAHLALKDRKWQSVQRGSIIETIKGKPYCLKLGNTRPQTDNFLGFFQTFYSYLYQDQLTKPIVKPSKVSFNPLVKAQSSGRDLKTRSVSREGRQKTMMSYRQADGRSSTPLTNFHSVDLKPQKQRNINFLIKRQKTSKTVSEQNRSLPRPTPRILLKHKSAFDCSKLIDNCNKFLSDKFKPKIKPHRKHSIQSVSSQLSI